MSKSRRSAMGVIAKYSLLLPVLLKMEKSTERVPSPKFKIGDRVAMSFPGDGDEIITYQGQVQGSVFCPENLSLDNQQGKGWFYAVHWQVMPGCTLPHLFTQIATDYLEPEAELRRA